MKRPTPSKPRTPKKPPPYRKPGQARKHVTINERLPRLDNRVTTQSDRYADNGPITIYLSETTPPGHPNEWPGEDRNMFETFVRLSAAFVQTIDANAVNACRRTARFLRLPGGEEHWLVNAVLAGVSGIFYVRSGGYYAGARHFLHHATAADRRHLGRDAVQWAVELVRRAN